jgi:hypothetical protein
MAANCHPSRAMLMALLNPGMQRPLDAAMARNVSVLTLGSDVIRKPATQRGRPMSTINEETTDSATSFGRLVFLVAVPAMALSLMAVLALQHDSLSRQPATKTAASAQTSGTSAPLDARFDPNYTLYIMGSADDAHRLPDLGARAGLDWFAYVTSTEEEAELTRAREEADWFRYAAGLPTIRVVDLRLAAASPTAAHATMP